MAKDILAPLARLIRDKADRVCSLVDRVYVFSGVESLERQALDIHEALNRVIRSAQNGFAKHVRLIAVFQLGLPAVSANRSRLVQVLLTSSNGLPRDVVRRVGPNSARRKTTGLSGDGHHSCRG